MGLLGKVKGWLNIGGVSVKITEFPNPIKSDESMISGKFVLTTKTDRTILNTGARLFMEVTSGEGDEKKTTTTELGQMNTDKYLINTDYPFELAANETREMDFHIFNVNIDGMLGKLAEKGGVLGAVGKLGSMASKYSNRNSQVRYYLEVTADVQGTPLDPSDKVEVMVVRS